MSRERRSCGSACRHLSVTPQPHRRVVNENDPQGWLSTEHLAEIVELIRHAVAHNSVHAATTRRGLDVVASAVDKEGARRAHVVTLGARKQDADVLDAIA